jgi:catechol 2,3-dioxygenase-like lactoylglutathione lyase family enzyme
MRLELVPLPVGDVDRSKDFYANTLSFKLEVDTEPKPGMRVVQLTPPGSACSIVFGTGMPEFTDMPPGSVRALHLVVTDIKAVRDELIGRGAEIKEISDMGGVLFAYFADPDGNSWLLQEFPNKES